MFDDPRVTAVAAVNHAISWTVLLVVTPGLALLGLIIPVFAPSLALIAVWLDLWIVVFLVLTHKGHLTPGGVMLLGALWLLFFWLSWYTGGVRSPSVIAFVLLTLLGGMVHGNRWTAVTTCVTLASLAVLSWAEAQGFLPDSVVPYTAPIHAAASGAYLVALGLLQALVWQDKARAMRRAAQEFGRRRDAEQRLSDAIENAPFGAIVCTVADDNELLVAHVNTSSRRVLGVDTREFVGLPLQVALPSLAHESTSASLLSVARGGALFEAGHVPFEIGDERRVLEVHGIQVGADSVALFISDITERHATEAAIKHLAFHDQLTGLPNRATLINRLDAALAASAAKETSTALLFVDLDDFKRINDELGHAAGDDLLVEVAHRLSHAARLADTVARHAGDEFTILCPDIGGTEDLKTIAAKFIRTFDAPFSLSDRDIRVTASIGATLADPGTDTAGTLLEHADMAMYRMKRAGRNGYRIYS